MPKLKAELLLPPLQLPHPVTSYMLTPIPQLPTNLAPDAVISIPAALVQPLTMNATTATLLDTSQPCAGDHAPVDIQLIPPTRGGSPEANHTGPVVADIQAGCSAEEVSHAETIPETPEETSAPVTAHLKAAT